MNETYSGPEPEYLRPCEPEIQKFEEILKSFELAHSLAELLLIVDLTPEEAPKNPIREPARRALIPIFAQLTALKNETDISPEKYKALYEKYKVLSRAVGIINRNRVDHTR